MSNDQTGTTMPKGKSEQELLAELEKSLGEDIEAWMPEKGELLSGTIVQIETRRSEFGPYPALTVQRLDGSTVVFHAFRTVAQNEVLRQRPKTGDLIAVLYVGAETGTDYHNYRIRTGGASDREFDWGQFEEKTRA